MVLWGCQATTLPPAAAQTTPRATTVASPTGGPVMAIGGGKDQDVVMREFVRLSGGPQAAIVVVPLASDDPTRTGTAYVDYLKQLGCSQVSWLVPGQTPDGDQQVRQAKGLFFSGGDQQRILNAWTAPWRQALQTAWQHGAVVAGTSAGAMVWGRTAILGGDPQSTAWYGDDPHHDGIRLGSGYGLLPRTIVDTHFSERGRLPRLAFATAKQSDAIGLGVDPQTAAVISGDGRLSVIGSGTVTVVQVPPQPIRLPLSLVGMAVSLVGSGGTWSESTASGH